jgi:hypothetical protein
MMQIAGPTDTALVRIDVFCCEKICAHSADLFRLHVYLFFITGSTGSTFQIGCANVFQESLPAPLAGHLHVWRWDLAGF